MSEEAEYQVEVRYGALLQHRWLRSRRDDLRRGDRCVIRTERGVELGVITRDPEPLEDEADPSRGEILRRVSEEDEERHADLGRRAAGEDFDFCVERIRERGLPMRLVFVEPGFGGGRIVFYFVADGRVDFRELVKDLARHFRTRIELRQIGVRDEAKILGDREYCDRELCCLSWMREILPVTMRMAKNQKSTLDPNKISGRCGRLKCCLRFEDEAYCELKARLPRPGSRVQTIEGPGRVRATDAMSGSVTVELEGGRRLSVPLDEIEAAADKAGEAP